MDSMDELRSPSRPTSPAASIIIFPLPSTLFVLQLLGTIRCPEKPREAQIVGLPLLPGPKAHDEADHDAGHKGCANPKTDDSAKGRGFRKGLHHGVPRALIRISFMALPCGLGFLESQFPAIQGGFQR